MVTNEKPHNPFCLSGALLLEPKEVASILKISLKTMHKLVREGKLSCVQVTARERRFTPEQVQQYIVVESQSHRGARQGFELRGLFIIVGWNHRRDFKLISMRGAR